MIKGGVVGVIDGETGGCKLHEYIVTATIMEIMAMYKRNKWNWHQE